MSKATVIRNLIREFGFIDGIRIVYWYINEKFNLKNIEGIKTIHGKFLGGGADLHTAKHYGFDLAVGVFWEICG